MKYDLITSGASPYNIAMKTVDILSSAIPGAHSAKLIKAIAVKIDAVNIGANFSWSAFISLMWSIAALVIDIVPGIGTVAKVAAKLISEGFFL